MMTKVVHDTDIGSGLEISGGKLNAAATMATDVEVAAAIAAQDVLEDAEDLAQLEAKLTKHVGGFQGDAESIGRRNLGVFEGLMYTRATNSAVGGFEAAQGATFNPVVGTDAGNAVVHFKLPWRADATAPNNKMYRLEFEGHSLNVTGAQKIIKTTVTGYAYQTGLVNTSVIGSHAATTTQYKGSDGFVYVRMEFTNAYYMTLVIDSMAVGNGEAMPHGSITAHFDNAATL